MTVLGISLTSLRSSVIGPGLGFEAQVLVNITDGRYTYCLADVQGVHEVYVSRRSFL